MNTFASTFETNQNFVQLALEIKAMTHQLGFSHVAITDTDLKQASEQLRDWLAQSYHGTMEYLARHFPLRAHPEALVPGTIRIIMVGLNNLPTAYPAQKVLADGTLAYISRYALGRDYHRFMRRRLQQLAHQIQNKIGPFGYRAFVDSAPVLEKPLAAKAGIGWVGKHTLLLNREAGSWFFLGALFTDLPLPIDEPIRAHCGQCRACIDVCPTKAIVAPYLLDARRCIAYLTIEYKGSIPIALRPLMGNRVFGCDDCQLICPWNKFAKLTQETRLNPRFQLDKVDLLTLFSWTEQEYLRYTEGSPLRRTGFVAWLRNIAVALGNAPYSPAIITQLNEKMTHTNELVREHAHWALLQQNGKKQ